MSLRVELRLDDIELAFRLVVLFAESVDLVLLLLHLHPVPSLHVLLDLHPKDVGVNWQGHLVSHCVNFSLLLFNCAPHVIQTLL